ncbi:hypothetical protein PM01_08705 [Sulfitobacter pontiacus 3SOLIMAR09]|nr:hypothetical protein PM01_08705 [Sulfitobacter pontiacus 3SOLIMAR09]
MDIVWSMQSRQTTDFVLKALLLAQARGQGTVSFRSECSVHQITLTRQVDFSVRKTLRDALITALVKLRRSLVIQYQSQLWAANCRANNLKHLFIETLTGMVIELPLCVQIESMRDHLNYNCEPKLT